MAEVVKDGTGATILTDPPAPPATGYPGNPKPVWIVGGSLGGASLGQQLAASSSPVVLASDQSAVAVKPGTAGQATMAASFPVAIASDQSSIPVRRQASAAANGITSARVVSAATTNATSVKASVGSIAWIDVYNLAATVRFLKLYNKASAPTVGTDTPVLTIPIPAGGGFSREYTFGRSFATGIAYAITGAVADSDTTAVVANDVVGEIGYL